MATAASARVPLRDAIATAEQHLQGKGMRAAFEAENGSQGEYKIEVVAGVKVFDVRIDADNGTVITAQENKADSDDEEKN